MQVIMKSKIDWKEGAILLIKRLSPSQIKEINNKIRGSIVPSLEESKLEEGAKKKILELQEELKITPDELTQNKIKKEIEDFLLVADRNDKIVRIAITFEMAKQSIYGWENIIDENGDKLAFDDTTREHIFNDAISDEKVLESLITWIRGPLGNSKAGSISQSNTNGSQDCANDASNVK